MASSSHYHYHKDDDDEIDSMLDDYAEKFDLIPEPKERKQRIFIERHQKKATRCSGMITLARL